VKTLTYDGRAIEFEDPAAVVFDDNFHKTLYSLVFNAITDGSDYEPVINSDEIYNQILGLDLVAMAQASGIDCRRKPSSKATNKGRLVVQYHVQFFLDSYPAMLGLFQNVILNTTTAIKNAEVLIGAPCDSMNFIQIKQIIDHLNTTAWTRDRDGSEKQSGVSTLGAISEELLTRVFERMVDPTNFFKVSSSQVQSYGDFVLMCLPNNLWISVKSNFARERLLASGYSNDILGVGFFQDFEEFTSQVRVRNFQRAGFLAMYCPDASVSPKQVVEGTNTYDQVCAFHVSNGTKMPLNINGKPFIRRLSTLGVDLQSLLDVPNIQRRFTVSF
jgi:hypothetical protein